MAFSNTGIRVSCRMNEISYIEKVYISISLFSILLWILSFLIPKLLFLDWMIPFFLLSVLGCFGLLLYIAFKGEWSWWSALLIFAALINLIGMVVAFSKGVSSI